MLRLSVYFVALCLFIQASDARTISMDDLLERIEKLESWKSDTEKEIQTLREVVAKQEVMIEKQASILESYADDAKTNEPVAENSEELNTVNKENELSGINSVMSSARTNKHTTLRPHIRQIAGGVAFTAYLSHDAHVGNRQTIKFDKVITNDGNGYNIYTGVFTCPEDGVYLFSFTLGGRSNIDAFSSINAELVINNKIIVSGSAESWHIYQDTQGGNMAVASDARTISMDDLLERIEKLEGWKSESEIEIQTLREVVAKQEAIIEKQARIIESYADDTSAKEQDVGESEEHNAVNTEKEVSVIDSRRSPVQTHSITKHRQHIRQIAGGVAFTAYLAHDVDPGRKQTIKFDKVITNDGNGYNNNTGIFTCPEDGVYLFSFFLGQRGAHDGSMQMSAELVVNNNVMVTGVVETQHVYQDLQGGNMAVVRLNLGDAVWVESVFDGHHVEGSQTLRLTTFSGVYLYA
ncbi:Complement C1q-like protein 3 [Mactra antiquata]